MNKTKQIRFKLGRCCKCKEEARVILQTQPLCPEHFCQHHNTTIDKFIKGYALRNINNYHIARLSNLLNISKEHIKNKLMEAKHGKQNQRR